MSHPTDTSIYAHGKLLISAEYYVLDGALALAVPTIFGQYFRAKTLESKSNLLYWVALSNRGQVWLNLAFDTTDFSCVNSATPEAKRLSDMLIQIRKMSPDFLKNTNDIAVETRLEFPNEWGLGTSSTLIYSLAKWANVDGYKLLKSTIGGSGYDIACAPADTPILYHLANGIPQSEAIDWEPSFKGKIYFAYLGNKQLSSKGIQHYKEKTARITETIEVISGLTKQMMNVESLSLFEETMIRHEELIAQSMGFTPVKQERFPDYWGEIKSLGAWGGDFVMMTNEKSIEDLTVYLNSKGINLVFTWDELIFKGTKKISE